MLKFFYIICMWSFLMTELNAKEYSYLNNIKQLPERIEINDNVFISNIYSYFNEDNILKSDNDYHNFKPVVRAKISVEQIDSLNLKVNVLLINNKVDWYIPRFEEKTIYSEKKVYLMGNGNRILAVYPEWWPRKERSSNSPSVYIPRPEHIGLFAKFKKDDTYKLEYKIRIPDSVVEKLSFDLFYQDSTMPTEIFTKYQESNKNYSIPNLTTKSNIVKVICKKVSKDKSDGYLCEFSN